MASKDSIWIQSQATAYKETGDFIFGDYFSYQPRCAICVSSAVYTLPSLTVEGMTYNNVVRYNGFFPDGYGSEYYWAPLIGLIKTAQQNPGRKTYTLLRHN